MDLGYAKKTRKETRNDFFPWTVPSDRIAYSFDYQKSNYAMSADFLFSKAPLEIEIELNGETVGWLPTSLQYLKHGIEKSKGILSLLDDWDSEGSEKYDERTWVKSIQFLIDYARTLYYDFNISIDPPKIYEGPKGSIDVIWEVEKYRLVINVDKNGEDAMFYADNYKDQRVEGAFKLKHYNRFLLPIATQS